MKRWIGILALVVCAFAAGPAHAQSNIPAAETLVQAKAAPVTIAAGARGETQIHLTIADTWHINANPPALDYMIPTEISLTADGEVGGSKPIYPTPHKVKLSFEDSELLVYDQQAIVRLPIAAGAGAKPGVHTLAGQVSFQACNDQVCLAPAKVPFTLVVTVTPGSGAPAGASAAPAGGDTNSASPPTGATTPPSGPQGTGFTTGPPPGGSLASSPPSGSAQQRALAQALAIGGMRWWVLLFVGGLLLNLTPCVFPMLGVTVSIFGARRAEATPKVVLHAVLYVLGIVITYSVLGVIAAFTGSLFGAALQSLWVSIAIAGLMIVLSLSMFGLYELQPPAWLLTKLGGADTTSLLGIFVSGLGVGVIAAPCIGPFVVAVLALIAARQDVLFGLQTMATLSLGLGAPYLVLATFSNLLQRLPRSGMWMVWVKKVFGVILLSVGAFYLSLAIAPKWSGWVLPAALLLGGVFLGFLDRSGQGKKGFQMLQRAAGAVAVAIAVVLLVTTPSPGLAFREFSSAELQASLTSGRPAMIDFSADWCIPCHELERNTFTNDRVVRAAQDFHAYKVDLTRYDSPESESLRKQYGITGVPTVVFLDLEGREVRDARVEGFLPPEQFLDRMRLAAATAKPERASR
jgi:thiol:disulfide interchange protein DsbD